MSNLMNKLRRDRGDSVLVTIIICIPLFMAAFMFSVGLAMNAWTKTSFADSAQAAAQAAAGDISNKGYLDEGSIGTYVSEYMRLTQRSNGTAAQMANNGTRQTAEATGLTCATVEVDGKTYPTPYIEVSLDRSRTKGVGDTAAPLYISAGGAAPTAVYTLNTRVNYRVLSATVYESSTSLLGDGFAVLGKDAGCYTSRSEVSGITFGANEDLNQIGGDASCWTPTNPTDTEDTVMKTNGSIKLYSGPDYTCPVVGYLSSPYVLTTHEYGSFFKITYGGNSYWVHNLEIRAPDQCTDRSLTDRKATVTPAAQYSTGAASNVKIYSAPFPDCVTPGGLTGEVTVVAKYEGPYGIYYQLNDGRWVSADDLKAMRTVTFVPNGGAGGGTVRIYDGGTINAPATPTRTGYNFAGWFTAPTGGAQVTFPRTVTTSATYYAQWALTNYTISYNGNGGTVSGCSPATYTVAAGANAPASCGVISRPGYTFTGFTPGNIPAGSTGNKTFTANWSIITYSITYNGNGGTVAGCAPTSYNVNSGNITPSCTPVRTNYNFTSWSPTNIPSGSTGNKTFVANWSVQQYTVSFNTRGGSAIASQVIGHGSNVSVSNPSRSGWTFRGWSTSSTSGAAPNVSFPRAVTANATYYAHWQRTITSSYSEPANLDVTHPAVRTVRVVASCSRGSYDGGSVRAYVYGAGGSGWTPWAGNGTTFDVYAIVGYYWGSNYGWSGQGGNCNGSTSSVQYD